MTAAFRRPEGPGPEGPRHRWRVEELARMLESFATSGPVLDAGCGRGRLARRLAESGWDVCALDIEARWLAAPGEQLAGTPGARPAKGAGPLTVTPGESSAARGPFWALASASSVPWPDEEFGAVALGEVLEHVENEREVVAEVVRVLRPGGVLVISVPAGPARIRASDVRSGHFRRYDRLGLRALLGGSDLDVELIRGWGWPVGRLYDRLAYRASHGQMVRRAARSRALVVLEWLFGMESRWDSGDHGAGLIAVARRPLN